MSVIPDKKNEQIQFAEQHWPIWDAAPPTAIGLTAAKVTAIKDSTVAARTSFDAALAARQASKAATTQSDNDIAAMFTLLSDGVKQIRLFAETTNDPNVYAEAQIPAPAAPTPALPPTQPIELRGIVGSLGQLTVEWKASPSSASFDSSTVGVTYTIRRRLAGQTGYTYIGTVQPSKAGKRGFSSFVDDTLPANPDGLQYVVQGVRGSLNGPVSEVLSITLGMGGDGAMFVQDSSTMKIAA